MTCREFWSRMPELSLPKLNLHAPDHLRECADCAAALERQQALAEGLRHLAEKRARLSAPPRLETELLQAFRSHAAVHVPHSSAHWWARPWSWAVAAGLVLGLVFAWNLERQPGPTSAPEVASVESAASTESDAGFIPLPYASETIASDEADLVHVRVARSTLIALGVPLTEGADEAVEAEVLLGVGGTPQAVRILQ